MHVHIQASHVNPLARAYDSKKCRFSILKNQKIFCLNIQLVTSHKSTSILNKSRKHQYIYPPTFIEKKNEYLRKRSMIFFLNC